MCRFTICDLLWVTVVLGLVGCAQRDNPSATPQPLSAVATARSAAMPSGKLIDLTHSFDEQTIYWPTEAGFLLELGNNGPTDKGYYYTANRFRAAEHGGTHIDAPIHFHDQRHTVDQIELERLIGQAVVIDVSEQCRANRDYEITVADLRNWETAHSRQLTDVIVLLRTGWSSRWPDREAYLGTSARGPSAIESLHFPGLSPDAAQWLAEHRLPKAVGIDTASIDFGQSTNFESHVTLFKKNIPAFENVANLDQLPTQGALVMALPMKIAGGSGAPLRTVAIIPEP